MGETMESGIEKGFLKSWIVNSEGRKVEGAYLLGRIHTMEQFSCVVPKCGYGGNAGNRYTARLMMETHLTQVHKVENGRYEDGHRHSIFVIDSIEEVFT